MVTTRSKTGSAPAPKQDPQRSLEHELNSFPSHSLLSWAEATRNESKGRTRKGKSSKTAWRPHVAQSYSKLLNLPLDLLAIIFSYCHPKSLLQLSRTSQDLRAFLGSRRSASVWIAARKGAAITFTEDDVKLLDAWRRSKAGVVSLPPCPSYMSEIAYASLMFEDNCSYCQRIGGGRFKGCLNVRVCMDCSRTEFTSKKKLEEVWKRDTDPRFFDILPWNASDYPEYYRKPSSNAWHQPTAEAIFERLLNYEMDVGLDARAMDAFFERAQAEIKERLDFMDQFGEFQSVSERLDYIERRKQKAREEARFKDNLTMAHVRLVTSGVECEASDLQDCREAQAAVRQIQGDLDSAAWQQLRVQLPAKLKHTIETRKYVEAFYDPVSKSFRNAMHPVWAALAPPQDSKISTYGWLTFADFLELPTIKTLREQFGKDQKREAIRAALADKVDDVHREIKTFLTKVEDILILAIRRAPSVGPGLYFAPHLEITREVAHSPMTVYLCQQHRYAVGNMEFADVMRHPCFQRYSTAKIPHAVAAMRERGLEMEDALLSPFLLKSPLITAHYEQTSTGFALVKAVRDAGMSVPSRRKAFENLPARFLCEDCEASPPQQRSAMSALRHMQANRGHRKVRYIKPSPEELEEGSDLAAEGGNTGNEEDPNDSEEEVTGAGAPAGSIAAAATFATFMAHVSGILANGAADDFDDDEEM